MPEKSDVWCDFIDLYHIMDKIIHLIEYGKRLLEIDIESVRNVKRRRSVNVEGMDTRQTKYIQYDKRFQ